MKPQFDPVAALFGVLFILAGVGFGSGGRVRFSELAVFLPLLLILIGAATLIRNGRKDRND